MSILIKGGWSAFFDFLDLPLLSSCPKKWWKPWSLLPVLQETTKNIHEITVIINQQPLHIIMESLCVQSVHSGAP